MAKNEREKGGGKVPGSEGENLAESLFDQMQEDSYIVLKRRNTRTQQMETVARLEPSQAVEETIQEMYGGGYYTLVEKVRAENGSYVYGRSRSVTILGEPKAVVLPPAKGGTAAPEAGVRMMPAPGNLQSIVEMGILQMFEGMQSIQKMQTIAMTKLMESGRAPQNDRMFDVLIAMIQAQGAGKSDQGEVMRLAKEIAELRAPEERRGLGQTLEELKSLKDAAGILGMSPDNGGEDDSWAGVAKQFLPVVADAIKSGKVIDARKAGRTLKPGEPVTVLDKIRPFIPRLMSWAEGGKNPIVYAQVTLDNMPQDAAEAMQKFLGEGREAALTKWWAAFPNTTAHREWFIAYATGLAMGLGVNWDGAVAPAPAPAPLPKNEPGL